MYIPVIWDKWKQKGEPDLYSVALIADDPPEEAQAASHDRCPIFLKASAVDACINVYITS